MIVVLIVLLAMMIAEAKVLKVAVVVRVPRRGSFLHSGGEHWKEPHKAKLHEEEIHKLVQQGKRLQELYVRSSRLLPVEFDTSKTVFHSVDSPRAIQAMQAIGSGLYSINDFLPVTVVAKPLDDLLRFHHPGCMSAQQQRLDKVSSVAQDLARLFNLADQTAVGDWILESSLVRVHEKDELRKRIEHAMRGKYSSALPQSRLAHEVFVEFFASSAQQGMRVFVIDEDEIMWNFLPNGNVNFPLPRTVIVELHDETEVDQYSSQQFVHFNLDGKAQSCNNDLYCEASAYIASIASKLQSHEEWERSCDRANKVVVAVSTHEEEESFKNELAPLTDAFVDESATTATASPTGPCAQLSATAAEDTKALSSLPVEPASSEDDFYVGFLFGSLVTGILMYWCCIGGRDESTQYLARVRMEQERNELQHYKTKLGESDAHMDNAGVAAAAVAGIGGADEVKEHKRRSHVIPHIPRHGDPIV